MRVPCLVAAAALLVASCDDGADEPAAATAVTAAPVSAGDVAAIDLVVGDCVSGLVIGAAERRTIDSAHVVDCESRHELEVFATFDLAAADFSTAPEGDDGAYPGEQRVVAAADEGCASRLDALGVADGLGVIALWPTVQSWSQGDRGVVCAAFSDDGKPFQSRHLIRAEAP